MYELHAHSPQEESDNAAAVTVRMQMSVLMPAIEPQTLIIFKSKVLTVLIECFDFPSRLMRLHQTGITHQHYLCPHYPASRAEIEPQSVRFRNRILRVLKIEIHK